MTRAQTKFTGGADALQFQRSGMKQRLWTTATKKAANEWRPCAVRLYALCWSVQHSARREWMNKWIWEYDASVADGWLSAWYSADDWRQRNCVPAAWMPSADNTEVMAEAMPGIVLHSSSLMQQNCLAPFLEAAVQQKSVAGLLTSLSAATPSQSISFNGGGALCSRHGCWSDNQWLIVVARIKNSLQQRDCPGFSPDSLLITFCGEPRF